MAAEDSMQDPVSPLDDQDMKNATQALLRAAKRAREIARQTGTAIVVMRDGKLVREFPQPETQKPTPKTDESTTST